MSALRVFIVVFALLLVVGGFVAIAAGGWAGLMGLWFVIGGLVILGGTLLERRRYRSSVTETGFDSPGPGGGEPLDEPLASRFDPTEERFVDPTSGVTMRVWVDRDTGERRYRADR